MASAPGEMMFRPAQPVRALARIERRDAAVGPRQQPLARLVLKLRAPPPGERHQAARSLHHHASRFVDRRPDQRDPHRPAARHAQDPFRPGAGLAEAAPGQHQPGVPAARGRLDLPVIGPHLERRVEREQLAGGHCADDPLLFGPLQRAEAQRLAPRQRQAHARSSRTISASRPAAFLVSISGVDLPVASARSRSRSSWAMIFLRISSASLPGNSSPSSPSTVSA